MEEEEGRKREEGCIFCQIIDGKVASKKVFEDDQCIVVMDINPANPGHLLVLPKDHYSIMPLMPTDLVGHMFVTARRMSLALLRVLKTSGCNLYCANGTIAGQKAPHFMIHLVPRKENDGLHVFSLPENDIGEKDQLKLRELVANKVAEVVK